MPVEPLPCGSGADGSGADVEQTLLCDVLPDGTIAGTALAVYEYDETGTPVGPPTFVDPATGLPYAAQGILQPCPGDVGCGAPTQFCFQSTAPVDQPGRMYDTTLTIAQGFAVQGIVNDLVDTPVNVLWEVTDPDGTQFAANLQTALQSQFPGQTVTVTPGVVDPCSGGTADFAIHIECLRLDQDPPNLLQLRYNGGRDLIINPAFLSTPPLNNIGFLKRQDQASPVATADVLCTNVANRGWETNDINNSFETWGAPGSPFNIAAGTTPTPRGTTVQEINSWGSGAQTESPGFGDDPNTIWQTFVVPAAGNFTVRVVVGGRASTENIAIRLSTGDVDAAGIGDVINTSVNAGQVTTQDSLGNNSGTGVAGPWTTFNQTVPLAAGTYTLAFTGPPKPPGVGGNAFGGLFTDMRVFQDAPNTIENFVNDDDTCVVPTTETSTVCEFWAPRCSGGEIVGWYNVADGEDLTNAEFWAQVPAPTCCTGTSGEGSSSVGNLVYTYAVCATLNGETRTMQRVVVSDQAGGIIADSFVDTDGGPVTPDTWQPGDCGGDAPTVGEFVLCDDAGPFVRKLIQNAQGVVTQVVNVTLAGAPYVPVGSVVDCGSVVQTPESLVLCDIAQVPSPDGDRSVLDLTALANGPTAGAFDNGIGFTVDQGVPGGSGTYLITTGTTQNWTFSEPAMLRFGVNNLNVGAECVTLPVGTVVESIHANHAYNALTRVLCNGGAAAPADESIFTLDAATALAITSNPGGGGQRGLVRLEAAPTIFTEVRTPFLRTICRTCGETPVITDTTMDGLTPYVPAGTVGVCDLPFPPVEEECHNGTTLLVCDLPTGDPDGAPVVTDTAQQFIPDIPAADFIQRPGGGGALWTGGVINFGPDVDPGTPPITQIHRFAAATLQADPPSCTDGTVHLSLSVEVLNVGPGAGCSGAGRFRLYRVSDGAVLSSGTPLVNTPAGASVTLTIEADILAAELTAGNVAVWLDVETWQTGTCAPPDSKTWQASNFTAAYAFGQEGCETQFFRTVVTDCETGETVATVDTTVDGDPYTVTGEVGQCIASGSTGSSCPCVSAPDIGTAVAAEACERQVIERCGCDDTDGDTVGDVTYTELWSVDPCHGGDPVLLGTYLDGDLAQPYTPVEPVECSASETADEPLLTGIERLAASSTVNYAAVYPGLQSISITVLAGGATVTMTTGTAVPVPAGTSLAWSVADDDDSVLADAEVTATAGTSDVLVHWTYKSTSAG